MGLRTEPPKLHHSLPACGVCGCKDVDVDYVEDATQRAAYALELGECPRCDHRWTRPLRIPTRHDVRQAAAVRMLEQSAEAIPSAA
jgi:hypothetical protein